MKKEKEQFLNQVLNYIRKEKTIDELCNYSQGVVDALFPNADEQFRGMINSFVINWQGYYLISKDIEKEFNRYEKLNKGQPYER